MGQLTLARFRGDTVFALFARLISTLGGVIIGMVMWCVLSFLRRFYFGHVLSGTFRQEILMVWQLFALCVFPSFFMLDSTRPLHQ